MADNGEGGDRDRARRRMGSPVHAGPGSQDPDAAARLKDAFARWASGVAVVAIRDGASVYAITVSAFTPVSVDPPLVLLCVGRHATVRPFLVEGATFGVSVLAREQRRLASIFADTGPLARTHLPAEGDPHVPGALAAFSCTVLACHPGGDHDVVIATVERVDTSPGGDPLVFWERDWHELR